MVAGELSHVCESCLLLRQQRQRVLLLIFPVLFFILISTYVSHWRHNFIREKDFTAELCTVTTHAEGRTFPPCSKIMPSLPVRARFRIPNMPTALEQPRLAIVMVLMSRTNHDFASGYLSELFKE